MGRCWCCPTGYSHSGHTLENLCIQTHKDHTVDLQNLPYTHTDLQTHLNIQRNASSEKQFDMTIKTNIPKMNNKLNDLAVNDL